MGGGSSSGGLWQPDLCQVLWEGCLCSSSQPRLGGGGGTVSISQRRLRLRCSVTRYVQLLMGDLGFHSISPLLAQRALDKPEDCVPASMRQPGCVFTCQVEGLSAYTLKQKTVWGHCVCYSLSVVFSLVKQGERSIPCSYHKIPHVLDCCFPVLDVLPEHLALPLVSAA